MKALSRRGAGRGLFEWKLHVVRQNDQRTRIKELKSGLKRAPHCPHLYLSQKEVFMGNAISHWEWEKKCVRKLMGVYWCWNRGKFIHLLKNVLSDTWKCFLLLSHAISFDANYMTNYGYGFLKLFTSPFFLLLIRFFDLLTPTEVLRYLKASFSC